MDDTTPPEDPRSRDLVSVGNYPNSLAAESVRSCLEMEGLEAFVFDGEITNMNGLYIAAYGGVKVMASKDPLVEISAVHARKTPSQNPSENGLSDSFRARPQIFLSRRIREGKWSAFQYPAKPGDEWW